MQWIGAEQATNNYPTSFDQVLCRNMPPGYSESMFFALRNNEVLLVALDFQNTIVC